MLRLFSEVWLDWWADSTLVLQDGEVTLCGIERRHWRRMHTSTAYFRCGGSLNRPRLCYQWHCYCAAKYLETVTRYLLCFARECTSNCACTALVCSDAMLITTDLRLSHVGVAVRVDTDQT